MNVNSRSRRYAALKTSRMPAGMIMNAKVTTRIQEIPAAKIEVVDTTGAGDAFNSGFAVALAEGRDVLEAARFGVACGALVCTRLGVIPGMPQRAAAEEMFRKIPTST